MNIKQKQLLLAFLGYYTGQIDGIWGDLSARATREFQGDYGIEDDGIFGPETEKRIRAVIGAAEQPGDLWEQIPHFDRAEFRCKCGGKYCGGFPAEPKAALVRSAQRLRDHFGVPVLISSGVRCQKHNAAVGGVSDSRHLTGRAVDLCVSGVPAQQTLAFAQSLPQIRYAYAIDASYIHMDIG